MVDLLPFQHAVVLIMDTDEQLHGIGLLLTPNTVITCAHVVAEALRLDASSVDRPDGRVKINLPFVGGKPAAAQVIEKGWFPKSQEKLSDIAILSLNFPLDGGGYKLLSPAFSFYGLHFTAWVAQEGHETNLVPLVGTFSQNIANGRYLLDVQDSNYKIHPGSSGAPVVDPVSGMILGMIVQEELDESAEAGFLIPANLICQSLRQAGIIWQEVNKPELESLLIWANSRYRTRSRLRAGVVRFIESYRHRLEDPKPFVGRLAALQYLDHWLNQADQRLLILSSAAGRGKTALLLHWLAKITTLPETAPTVFFLPISIRFDIADEMSGVQLLHAVLADVFSELKDNLPQQPLIEDYLDRIFDAWDCIANRPEERFLLVIDGLDEAVQQWFVKRRVLPPDLPANIHVLVSARYKQGKKDGRDWLGDLGFAIPDAKYEQPCDQGNRYLDLTTLDRASMAEAIVQIGLPLDRLVEREEFVEALYWLTDNGDPLLLTLWLGQIWQHKDLLPQFHAETLFRMKPSFSGFYKLWMEDQKKLWQRRNLKIHPNDFEQIMHLLALAQAPLLLDDLDTLLKLLETRVAWDYEKLRDALESAHRLVIRAPTEDNDQHGFSFMHPRLADYFREELDNEPARLRALQQSYIDWGEKTVINLNEGSLFPDQCPAYVLRHYLTTHLPMAELSAFEVIEKYYRPLLQKAWSLTWHVREGVWLGYLNDIQHILNGLQQINSDYYREGRYSEMQLGLEVRCVMLATTMRTMNDNLPVNLVVALAKESIWSFRRAVRTGLEYSSYTNRVECLTKLAKIALKEEEKHLAIGHALEAAATILEKRDRVNSLSAVASQLRCEKKQIALKQALEVVTTITDMKSQAEALSVVAPQLPGERFLLKQALEAAIAISDEAFRTEALDAVASQLHGENALLQEALEAATAISDKGYRTKVLSTVASQLPGESKAVVLKQALDAATAISDEAFRAEALDAVASQLHGENALLQEALEAATAISDKGYRAKVLSTVASQLQGESKAAALKQALEAAIMISNEWNRTEVLSAVASQLQGESILLQQALEAATAILDKGLRTKVLTTVASQLQGTNKAVALKQALEAATMISNEWNRTEALSVVAPQLQGENALLQEALEAATAISDKGYRTKALTTVASQLQGESKAAALKQALEAASVISDEEFRAEAISVVASQLPGESKEAALKQALEIVNAISDEEFRTEALVAVASRLQGENSLLQEALEAAIAISDERRAYALSAVVSQLQGESVPLQQALDAASAISIEWLRADALSAVVSQLQGESVLLQQALDAAIMISNEWNRTEALSAVASQLQGESALLQQALEAATAISDERIRAEAISAVASQLNGESVMLQQVLEAATAISNKTDKAKALRAVASQLQGESKEAALKQALEAANAISDKSFRADALSAVASQLQGESKEAVLKQALEATTSISIEWLRAEKLRAVASQLQGESVILQQALEAANAISDVEDRTKTLSVVASQLPVESKEAALKQALEIVNAISDERIRANALSAVASQLQGESLLLQQALEAATAMSDEWERGRALSAVVSHLQGENVLLQQALEAAVAISDERVRGDALSAVASQLQGFPELQKCCLKFTQCINDFQKRIQISTLLLRQNHKLFTYDLWVGWLSNLPASRSRLLVVTGDLTEVAIAITGSSNQAYEIMQNIIDIGEWWP